MKIQTLINFLKKNYGKRTGAIHQFRKPFEVLVACVLSQRTREENTDVAARQLFAKAKTPQQILTLKDSELQKLIKPSGFYRQKAKTLKKLSKILIEKYNSKVPNTREELLKLPGVGFKTSAVIMSYCFDPGFIPVDVHVEKIAKRLGFADEKDDVETVREKLEAVVSKEDRYHFHLELIHFGRDICHKSKARCHLCPFTKNCLWYLKLGK